MARRILITGANRGLGLALTRLYAARGEAVTGTARRPEAAPELQALGIPVEALDVGSDASIAALGERWAGRPLDVLVNNSGVQARARSIHDVDPGEARRAFDVNALGPVLVTRALLPSLQAGAAPLVVHLSSKMGTFAQYTGPVDHAYRATKAALNMFHRCLSDELGPQGITCVAVHPGWVRTDMGGSEATLGIDESVASFAAAIDRATPADNGALWDHEGRPLGW